MIEKKKLMTFDQSLNSLEKSLLTHFLGVANPKVIIELGVHKGSTTKHIIEFLEKNKINSKIYGFDLDEVLKELIRTDKIISTYIEKNILELYGGVLPESLNKFLSKNNPIVDFVLIDAKHQYKSVLGELELIWPYLSKNGFIICHDYHKVRLQYAIEHFVSKKSAKFIPILNTSSKSDFQSSLAVLTKPKLKFKLLHWLGLHYDLNKVRGYYFFKRIYKYFKYD
jgi:hypothetical protein